MIEGDSKVVMDSINEGDLRTLIHPLSRWIPREGNQTAHVLASYRKHVLYNVIHWCNSTPPYTKEYKALSLSQQNKNEKVLCFKVHKLIL